MTFWNRDLLPTTRIDRALAPLNDLDDVFDRFRRDFFSPDIFRGIDKTFLPKVEVMESDESIHVSAELPGMNEKDINVTLKDDILILQGEKRSEKKKEDKGYYSSEFSYGSFYRAVPILAEVDADKVNAVYKNGILEVTLHKLEQNKQKAKRIQIMH